MVQLSFLEIALNGFLHLFRVNALATGCLVKVMMVLMIDVKVHLIIVGIHTQKSMVFYPKRIKCFKISVFCS